MTFLFWGVFYTVLGYFGCRTGVVGGRSWWGCLIVKRGRWRAEKALCQTERPFPAAERNDRNMCVCVYVYMCICAFLVRAIKYIDKKKLYFIILYKLYIFPSIYKTRGRKPIGTHIHIYTYTHTHIFAHPPKPTFSTLAWEK